MASRVSTSTRPAPSSTPPTSMRSPRWPPRKSASPPSIIRGKYGRALFWGPPTTVRTHTMAEAAAATTASVVVTPGLDPIPVIELRNVSKTFGEVRSLTNVNFKVMPSEIVGLLGDNGAGKSTLVKSVMGFHRPDPGGEIYFKGQRIDDWSVARARALGIETVYQERALCEK